MIIVWEFLCMALLVVVFCRLVKTDTKTRIEVRGSLCLLGVAALVGVAQPLYGWSPDWASLLLLLSILSLQISMSSQWRAGVPFHFIDSIHQHKRRESDRKQNQ